MSEKIAIAISNLFFSYEKSTIFSNLSLNIKENDLYTIIGPNGSGKTTLLKLILGLLVPQSGKILIHNLPPEKMRTQLGYVPQLKTTDRDFPISVFELVLSGRHASKPWYKSLNKQDEIEVIQILENLSLSHLKNHSFGELSGGQAQRVLIARALVCHPKLLILDEPFANLDYFSEQKTLEVIDQLKQFTTCLLVTHDLEALSKKSTQTIYVHNQTAEIIEKQDVCRHFSMGIFHQPFHPLEALF